MKVKKLRADLLVYLKMRNLTAKYDKQIRLLETDIRYKSLNFEKLNPKHIGLYSFRIDGKYRATCVKKGDMLEIIDINNHYN